MSSIPVNMASPPPRKSFAQVAAAAHGSVPPSKQTPTNKANNVQNAQQMLQQTPQQTPKEMPQAIHGAINVGPQRDSRLVSNGTIVGPAPVGDLQARHSESQQLPILLHRIHLQDDPTAVVDSNLVARKEPDAKSVASRTTIALDEKESLLPDDSASMQAAPEEDTFSPSGSIVAESRNSSDPDVKAFREQLHVIDRTGAAASGVKQVPLMLPRPVNDGRTGVVICPVPPTPTNVFDSGAVALVERPGSMLQAFVAPPDEKLLEALASPKDRLFVLKIEQDIIDFVKDSKEEYLQLPQTNSFYRMLSHKLADYYSLGHFVNDSMTSVRIYRTAQSRLPPPLIGPASTGDGSTPPPSAPMRMIMRRVLDRENGLAFKSGDVKLFDSQNSSKAPSETGVGSGGDETNEEAAKVKDKTALTREERENRYKEARARIFRDFKEEQAELNDGVGGPADKEVSRSSSASGIKKSKKPKKLKDDGFEARSAYSQYGNQPFQSNVLTSPTSDGSFYNPFAPYALGNYDTNSLRPQDTLQNTYVSDSSFGQQDSSGMTAWPNASQPQSYMMPQSPSGNPFGGQGSFDSHHAYGHPIGAFPSPNGAHLLTPKFGQTPLPGFPTDYNVPDDRMGWSQGPFNNGFSANAMVYNNGGGVMAEPNFSPSPMMFSPSATYAPSPVPNQQLFSVLPQHGYDRQQFNPRSQAFVPSMRGGMVSQVQSNTPPSFINTTPRPANSVPLQRQVSDTSQNANYNAFQMVSPSPNGTRMNGQNCFRSMPQSARQPQAPFSSTISKWGNPSTLPPKPPPPAISSPYIDPHNQQSLPPNPYSNSGRAAAVNDSGIQATL